MQLLWETQPWLHFINSSGYPKPEINDQFHIPIFWDVLKTQLILNAYYKWNFSVIVLFSINVFPAPPRGCCWSCNWWPPCDSWSPSHPPPWPASQATFSVKLGLFLRHFKSFFYFANSFLFIWFDNFAQKPSTRTSYIICGPQCKNGNSDPRYDFPVAGFEVMDLFTPPAPAVKRGQGLPEEGDRQCDMEGGRLWDRETYIKALSLLFHLGPWSLWPSCEGLL